MCKGGMHINRYLKYTFIVLGIVAFIELQILMYFTISERMNREEIPTNNTFMKDNRNMQDRMMNDDGNNGDISSSAITPGEDNKTSKKKTTTTTDTDV